MSDIQKIERLYRYYLDAQAELKAASEVLEKAKEGVAIASTKASIARDAYNQALAEYRNR